jgi:outer membrane protein
MKKIILTAAAVFAFSFANAQDKKDSGFGFVKGDFLLGGNVTSVTNGQTVIAPTLSYFISDKVALEAGITSRSGGTAASSTDFSVGMKYQMMKLGERFNVFTGAGLNIGDAMTSFGAGVHLNYSVTQHLSVGWHLGDLISYSKPKTGDATTTIDLNDYSNFLNRNNFSLIYKF